MKKNRIVIEELDWQGDDPDFYHAKGHCPADEFCDALCRELGCYWRSFPTCNVTHEWARDEKTGEAIENGWEYMVKVYSWEIEESYPVTVWSRWHIGPILGEVW